MPAGGSIVVRVFIRMGLILLALQGSALGGGAAVEAFPPVVVRTLPASGALAVDPATREIRVTFSKDMLTREMWSFVYAKPAAFPGIAGPIHYLGDRRTCVLSVALEPGKTYGMWINSREHNSLLAAARGRAERASLRP
jgi:hypothetical protein